MSDDEVFGVTAPGHGPGYMCACGSRSLVATDTETKCAGCGSADPEKLGPLLKCSEKMLDLWRDTRRREKLPAQLEVYALPTTGNKRYEIGDNNEGYATLNEQQARGLIQQLQEALRKP